MNKKKWTLPAMVVMTLFLILSSCDGGRSAIVGRSFQLETVVCGPVMELLGKTVPDEPCANTLRTTGILPEGNRLSQGKFKINVIDRNTVTFEIEDDMKQLDAKKELHFPPMVWKIDRFEDSQIEDKILVDNGSEAFQLVGMGSGNRLEWSNQGQRLKILFHVRRDAKQCDMWGGNCVPKHQEGYNYYQIDFHDGSYSVAYYVCLDDEGALDVEDAVSNGRSVLTSLGIAMFAKLGEKYDPKHSFPGTYLGMKNEIVNVSDL